MILTVTPNPAVDQVITLEEPLEPDSVQRGEETRFDSGGNGVNVSQLVRALDGETLATGIVGGFTGYFIEQNLAEFDVPTDFEETTDGPTRLNTTIHAYSEEAIQTNRVDDPAETERVRYQLTQSGPAASEELIDDLVETVVEHDPETVYIGGSLPPGMDAADVDRIAAAGDWETAVDVHGDILDQLEERYEYCRPNETHLQEATGIEIDSINACEEAAIELQKRGFERVIATMGEEGSMIVSGEQTLFAPAPDVDVVDVVAAGDAMFGAILWAHQQGWSDETALKAGVAAARKLITTSGTSVRDLDIEETIDDVRVWQLQT